MKQIKLLTVMLTTSLVSGISMAASTSQNNGTKLTAASDAASIQCLDSNSALVEFTTTITSSGSVDSAAIVTSLDNEESIVSGWIEPQDFAHSGRFKTAVSSFSEIFSDGSHTISSCYVQSGADGRLSKQTCADPKTFEVSCAPVDPCADSEVFGNVVGNGNLCSGQALPVHIKGSFGEGGTLAILKDGFSTTIRMDRSGNSCVYQGQYRPYDDGNGGAGNYTFTLLGDNGTAYTFSASLKCK